MRQIGTSGFWVGVTLLLGGCDQLPPPFGPKPPAAAPAAESPASAAGPAKAQLTDPGVLALVNGAPVTVVTFRRRMGVLPEQCPPEGFLRTYQVMGVVPCKPTTPEERQVLLDELIKEELAVQEAVTLGLERDADTKARIEDARRYVLLQQFNARLIADVSVTPEEVTKYYQDYKLAFRVPERIRVRQIAVNDLKQAEALRATAAASDAEAFAALARQHSIGPGKEQGGDVGWYVRALDKELLRRSGRDQEELHVFFEQLEPVAFASEVGQISQPVKEPNGTYSILRLEERVPATQIPQTEVADQIKRFLQAGKEQKKVQEYTDRLWSKAKTEKNDRRLQQDI